MADAARDYCLMLQARLFHTLASYGVQVVPGGIERHPKKVQFHLLPAAGTRHQSVLGLQREIQAGMGVDCEVVSNRRGLYVAATLPARHWRALSFRAMLDRAMAIARTTAMQIPALLGLDEAGQLVFVDLAGATTPHLLVAGTTGSGKTMLLKSLALSIAAMNRPSQIQVFFLDAKGYSFPALRLLPHVQAVACESDAWLAQAARVIATMEARLQAPQRIDSPHLLLAIDELADVLLTDGATTGGGLAEALVRLTQKGREVGVHLLAATQKPSAQVVNSLITSNLPCRLVGRVVSGTDAALASGQRQSGAQHLPGKGSFVMIAGGTMDRMTAPLVREADVEYVRALVHDDRLVPEQEAAPAQRVIDARAFFGKLAGRMRPASRTGRPAEAPPDDVIQQLVERYCAGADWPSRRAVQRMIGAAEGNKIAGAGRADAALVEARRRVQVQKRQARVT